MFTEKYVLVLAKKKCRLNPTDYIYFLKILLYTGLPPIKILEVWNASADLRCLPGGV